MSKLKFDLLFAPIENLLSLNKTKIAALKRLNILSGLDLLLSRPFRYRKNKKFPKIAELSNGDDIYIKLKIDEIIKPSKKSKPVEIYASNETGSIKIIFFRFHSFLEKILKPGKIFIFHGNVELYNFSPQLTHPEIIYDQKQISEEEPIYHLTYGITNNQIRTYIFSLINFLDDADFRVIDKYLLSKNLPLINDAFKKIHSYGNNNTSVENAIYSMKYLESFSNQLGFKYIRNITDNNNGKIFEIDKNTQNKILESLGFSLTSGQEEALRDIQEEQKSNIQMLRMLQGDVGCGKTLVSLLSAVNVLKSGMQVAVMAPTEVLASQHYSLFNKILSEFGYEVTLLTSKVKGKQRNLILDSLKNGKTNLIVGTHSLIQEKVKFKELGYVIVDEQHKFGVNQRMQLATKGAHPDILVMSATPIPRSLSLTIFGDLSMTKIMNKPKNRKEIKTSVMPSIKINEISTNLSKILEKGEKIYWICPLIEQSADDDNLEKEIDYIDVETRYNELSSIYTRDVGFLHGNMSSVEKEEIIEKFRLGEIKILVSTTVIEVGIDVPDATLIVIENSEKFGLAQLHQLRGRVGRSDLQSNCILIYGKKSSKIAFERMKIMRDSNDGFYISESDLKLRGQGDLLGERQSGEESFIFLDILSDVEIIVEMNRLANEIKIDNNELKIISIFNQSLFNNKLMA